MFTSKNPLVTVHGMQCACADCKPLKTEILAPQPADDGVLRPTEVAFSAQQCSELATTPFIRWEVASEAPETGAFRNLSATARLDIGRPAANASAVHARSAIAMAIEGRTATTASLILRYIDEACGREASSPIRKRAFQSMFDDRSAQLFKRPSSRSGPAMEWLDLPLADLRPIHIENYAFTSMLFETSSSILQRLRALDHLYTVARTKWAMDVDFSVTHMCRRIQRCVLPERISDNQEHAILYKASMVDAQEFPTSRVRLVLERDGDLGSAPGMMDGRESPRDLEAPVPRVEALCRLLLDGRVRLDEAVKLAWEDIDLLHHTVRLKPTKVGGASTQPLGAAVVKLLNRLPRDEPHPFRIGHAALKREWPRIAREVGLLDASMNLLGIEGRLRVSEAPAGRSRVHCDWFESLTLLCDAAFDGEEVRHAPVTPDRPYVHPAGSRARGGSHQ